MTRDPYPSFAARRRTTRAAKAAAETQRILLSVEEAGYMLGVGRTRMYELMKSGAVESVHVGRLRKIPVEALTDFVERCRSYVSLSSQPPSTKSTSVRCPQKGPAIVA